jgi:hypothetical protein
MDSWIYHLWTEIFGLPAALFGWWVFPAAVVVLTPFVIWETVRNGGPD